VQVAFVPISTAGTSTSGEKKPRRGGVLYTPCASRILDVGSLLAFRALRDFELYFLTFFEGLETVHVDCREVREQIFAAVIWSDEAETLGIIEPLNSTCCHKKNFLEKTNHTSHKSKKLLAPSSACSLLINQTIQDKSITALLAE
jgi:hypothetical protein